MMNTQLALEVARSELGQQVAAGDKATFRKEKRSSELRSLASIGEAEQIMPNGKTLLVVQACQIHERPRSASPSVGQVSTGQEFRHRRELVLG